MLEVCYFTSPQNDESLQRASVVSCLETAKSTVLSDRQISDRGLTDSPVAKFVLLQTDRNRLGGLRPLNEVLTNANIKSIRVQLKCVSHRTSVGKPTVVRRG